MRLRVIDFECTSLPPEADVVEAAYIDVVGTPRASPIPQHSWRWSIEEPGWSTLVRPTRPIEVEARAAHHISDAEAAAGTDWNEAENIIKWGRRDPPAPSDSYQIIDGFCAHNAAFEQQLFNPEGAAWICTYKAALRLWPEAPGHSNQALRYWLDGCDPGDDGMPPHRALPDCRVTALILVRCLERASVEDLVQWTHEPRLMPTIGFGKHRGKKWSEAPRDYVAWVLRQDFDEDTKWNARRGLEGK